MGNIDSQEMKRGQDQTQDFLSHAHSDNDQKEEEEEEEEKEEEEEEEEKEMKKGHSKSPKKKKTKKQTSRYSTSFPIFQSSSTLRFGRNFFSIFIQTPFLGPLFLRLLPALILHILLLRNLNEECLHSSVFLHLHHLFLLIPPKQLLLPFL